MFVQSRWIWPWSWRQALICSKVAGPQVFCQVFAALSSLSSLSVFKSSPFEYLGFCSSSWDKHQWNIWGFFRFLIAVLLDISGVFYTEEPLECSRKTILLPLWHLEWIISMVLWVMLKAVREAPRLLLLRHSSLASVTCPEWDDIEAPQVSPSHHHLLALEQPWDLLLFILDLVAEYSSCAALLG